MQQPTLKRQTSLKSTKKKRHTRKKGDTISADSVSDYTFTRVLQHKDTASQSVIAFGQHRITGLPVAIKFYLSCCDFEKLQYEGDFYEQLIKLQLPNTVRLVARLKPMSFVQLQKRSSSLSATVLLSLSEQKIRQTILHDLQKLMPDKDEGGIQVYGIVTEYKPMSISLGEWLRKNKATQIFASSCKSLLFQIIFTLAAMQKAGLQHNDLHLENILVDLKPPQATLQYVFDKKNFQVPVHASGQILLFDWDLGYCKACGHNPFLDKEHFCDYYGVCNALNPKFDIYTCLRYLQQHMGTAANDFIEYALGGSAPLELETFYGRMCNNGNNERIPVQDMEEGSYYKIAKKGNIKDDQWHAWAKEIIKNVFQYNGKKVKRNLTGQVKEIVCASYPPGQPVQVKSLTDLLRHPYFKEFVQDK